ncbi:MAG TPA: protein kinase [Kofleriaceae bacterium]|nr:protein kinase [Kofleriaceae bacterium]
MLAVISGRLADPELRDVEAHLDSCASCRSLVASAGRDPAEVTGPPGVAPSAAPGASELIGRYRVLRVVGSGGMGTVYAAQDPELDRVVALKLLDPSLAATDATALRSRLAREAQAMARLAHPNVITVHDIGSFGDQLFIAMEHVDGGTLRSWLRSTPRDWRAVVEVLSAAGRGLAAAHAAGVVHRDFKPDNVLVGVDGRVRVTDFGLARLHAAAAASVDAASSDATSDDASPDARAVTTSLSGSGMLVGTPAYMAAEQLLGEPADERSDVFSFCATAWEALYGARPFAGRDLAELRARVCAGELPARPDQPKLPDRMHEAIARGLHVAPDRRWPSMTALLAAIEGTVRPEVRLPRRARVAIGFAVAAVATLAAGGVAMLALRAPDGSGPPAAPARAERRALAILGVVDEGAAGDASSLAGLLTGRLAVELGAGAAMRLVPQDATRRVADRIGARASGGPTRAALATLRRTLGADLLLLGSNRVEPDGSVHLVVDIRDTVTGAAAAHIALDGSTQRLADLAADAGQALRRQLGLRDAAAADLAAARKSVPASPQAARLYADGQALLAHGDAGRARDVFERALVVEPDQPMVLAALAAAWKSLGYDERERDAARRAFENAPGLPRELFLRIEAQYREALRDWARAAEIWVTLSTFFPDELEYGLSLVQGLTRAGRAADAQAHLDRLRQLAPPAGADPRIDLAESDVATARGQPEPALAAAARAATAAEKLHEPLLVARAREQTCALLQNGGRFDDALAACRDALRSFEAGGDRGGMAHALSSIATLLVRFQRFDEAREPAERALAIYRDIGSQTRVATVTANIALAYAYVGDLARAEKGLTEAVALYREANERSLEAMASHNLASLMTEQGRLAEAEGYFRRTIEDAHALELRELEALASANLSIDLLRQGEILEARAFAERSVAVSRSLGNQRRLVFALDNLGQIQLRLGRLADARKALEEARTLNDKLGLAGAPVGQHLAEVVAAEGDLEGAEVLARQTVDDYRQKKMALGEVYALAQHARLLFDLGRTADARAAATRERALAEQIDSVHVREEIAATLALDRAARGDLRGAIGDLEAAIARSARARFIDTNLQQRLVLARLERMRGRRAASRRILSDLEADARKHSYGELAREIQALRRGNAAISKVSAAPK